MATSKGQIARIHEERGEYGAAFDAAWQEAVGDAVPESLGINPQSES